MSESHRRKVAVGRGKEVLAGSFLPGFSKTTKAMTTRTTLFLTPRKRLRLTRLRCDAETRRPLHCTEPRLTTEPTPTAEPERSAPLQLAHSAKAPKRQSAQPSKRGLKTPRYFQPNARGRVGLAPVSSSAHKGVWATRPRQSPSRSAPLQLAHSAKAPQCQSAREPNQANAG